MANAKNKHSHKIHKSRSRFLSSRAKSPTQKIILIVIVSAIITVFIALTCSLILNPENNTKTKISQLATEYYEDYFYPNVFSGNKDMSEILNRYTDTGLAKVSLRQLILSNSNLSPADVNFIRQHCDENTTFVQFFPTDPYNKTSYHTECTYSCSF